MPADPATVHIVHRDAVMAAGLRAILAACPALLLGRRFLSAAVTRSVADSLGREHLSGRETDVLQLLAEGCCNKTIARRLGIGVGTVKTHVKGVMSKLDATARTHALVVATQRGLVRPGAGDGASCAR